MDKVTGYVTGVNGNLVAATFSGSVRKNEVGYVQVGDDRLKGEVIRVNGDTASMQIYEMTNGIQVGDRVELSGELMSVELGPGLLTQVFDGLQNPLPELAQQCGFFLQRGVYLDPIPNKDWEFTPLVKPGDHVSAGDAVGSVPEGLFTHLIMVPFGLKDEGWRVKSVRLTSNSVCCVSPASDTAEDLRKVRVSTSSPNMVRKKAAIWVCGPSLGSNRVIRNFMKSHSGVAPTSAIVAIRLEASCRNCAIEATSSIEGTTVTTNPVEATSAESVINPSCGGQSITTTS